MLFGKLKGGGHVRVVRDQGRGSATSKLGFEFLEGPVTPKPEKIPEKRARKPRKPGVRKKPQGRRAMARTATAAAPPRGGTVPKVPLVKV